MIMITRMKIPIFFIFVVGISGITLGFIAILNKNETLVPVSLFLALLTFFLAIYINKNKNKN